jgi:hypothetical protein
MKRLVLVAALAPSMLLGGCSIRPTVDGLSGTPHTYAVVQRIRCETRDALAVLLAERLRRSNMSSQAEVLLRTKRFDFALVPRLDPATRAIFETYDGATIAYQFDFDITEVNNAGVGVGVTFPMVRGPLNLPLSASNNRERSNMRSFRVLDRVRELLTVMKAEFCETYGHSNADFMYPITGQIGMEDQIRLFFSLTQSANLAGNKDRIPTLSETLEFTTRISAAARPRIELARLGNGAQFSGASGDFEARREDVHKVIIVMTLPPESEPWSPSITESRGAAATERRRSLATSGAIDELNRQQDLQAVGNTRRILRSIDRSLSQ